MSTSKASVVVETVKLSSMKLARYNPRNIGLAAFEGLKSSIESFGYVEPIIFNRTTGNIVGGHQRYKALIDLDVEEADVVIVELDENQEKALNITLNNPNVQGSFTEEVFDLMRGIQDFIPAFEELRLADLLKEDRTIKYGPEEPDDDSPDTENDESPNSTTERPDIDSGDYTRQINLFISASDFDTVATELEAVRHHLSIDNVSDTVVRLIHDAYITITNPE